MPLFLSSPQPFHLGEDFIDILRKGASSLLCPQVPGVAGVPESAYDKKKKNPVALKPEWRMFYTLTNMVMNLHNLDRLYTQHNEMVSILSKKKLRMLVHSFRTALFFKKKKNLHFPSYHIICEMHF